MKLAGVLEGRGESWYAEIFTKIALLTCKAIFSPGMGAI